MKTIQIYELKSESKSDISIKYFMDRRKAEKAYLWEGIDALDDQLLAARYGGEQRSVDVTLSAIELRVQDEYDPATDRAIKIDDFEEISRKIIKTEKVG
nr:MAG TPA: hypothetical protein [Caudoviricetes sp.]